MNIKKIFLLFVVFCLISNLAVYASDNEAVILDELGFMNINDSKVIITKAEFVVILTKLINIDKSMDITGNITFKDVPSSHYAYSELYVASMLGIVNGDENGNLYPDEPISYIQAVKMLVSALGYDAYAQIKGGYPSGYLITAQEIDLTKGLTIYNDRWLTRTDAADLIYNALDVKVMKASIIGDSVKHELSLSDTLLSEYHNIYKRTGEIKGTYNVKLSSNFVINKDEVLIDDVIYSFKNLDLNNMVGYEVELYYRQSNDGTNELLSAVPRKKNYVLNLSMDDIIDADGTKIYYSDNDGKVRSLQFSIATNIIYNNVPIQKYDINDFLNKDGNIKLIDNNGDKVFDVIFLDVVKDIVVQSVDLDNCIIYDKYDSDNILHLDKNDKSMNVEFVDEYGNDMFIEELVEWDVLSVMKSHDGKSVRAYYSGSEIEGIVTSFESSGGRFIITIDGVDYETTKTFYNHFSDNKTYFLKVNDYGLFTLNIDKKITSFRRIDNDSLKLGYIVATKSESGLEDNIEVKILDENNKMKVLECAQNITLDGYVYKKKAFIDKLNLIKNQIIQYRTNNKGELSFIDTSEQTDNENDDSLENYYSDDNELLYIKRTCLFGNKIPINGKTKIFKIPSNVLDAEDNDYKVYSSSAYLVNNQKYAIKAYRKNHNNHIADAIILTIDYDNVIISSKAPVAVVCNITTAINEFGNEVYKIKCIVNDKIKEIYTRNKDIIDNITENINGKNVKHFLKTGDIIQYEDDDNVIIAVKLLYDRELDNESITMPNSTDTNASFRIMRGIVYSISEGNIFIAKKGFNFSDGLVTINDLESYNAAIFPICVYDGSKREKVFLGKLGDILDYKTTGKGSDLFIYTSYSVPGMIYIIK